MPGEHIAERLALQGVEVTPGSALADSVHRGLIRPPPVVDDGRPVGLRSGTGRGRLSQLDQAGTPVHQRPEHVEQQHAHLSHSRQYGPPESGAVNPKSEIEDKPVKMTRCRLIAPDSARVRPPRADETAGSARPGAGA